MDLLVAIKDKVIDGAGMELGAMTLFFKDGTMLRIAVEPRQEDEAPRDICATLTTYEMETD